MHAIPFSDSGLLRPQVPEIVQKVCSRVLGPLLGNSEPRRQIVSPRRQPRQETHAPQPTQVMERSDNPEM